MEQLVIEPGKKARASVSIPMIWFPEARRLPLILKGQYGFIVATNSLLA